MSELAMRSQRPSASSDEPRPSGRVPLELAPQSAIRLRACPLETPYCTIHWDERRALARFVRTERPYATIADIDDDGIAIQRVLERAGKVRLLVDLRSVMPRNDPGFEVAIANFRRRVLDGRQRVAILVRTAVGALQVKRHMREDGFQVEVFTSEEEALAYLEMRPSEGPPCSGRDWPAPRSHSWGRGPVRPG
jgi:hypothetical protein